MVLSSARTLSLTRHITEDFLFRHTHLGERFSGTAFLAFGGRDFLGQVQPSLLLGKRFSGTGTAVLAFGGRDFLRQGRQSLLLGEETFWDNYGHPCFWGKRFSGTGTMVFSSTRALSLTRHITEDLSTG